MDIISLRLFSLPQNNKDLFHSNNSRLRIHRCLWDTGRDDFYPASRDCLYEKRDGINNGKGQQSAFMEKIMRYTLCTACTESMYSVLTLDLWHYLRKWNILDYNAESIYLKCLAEKRSNIEVEGELNYWWASRKRLGEKIRWCNTRYTIFNTRLLNFRPASIYMEPPPPRRWGQFWRALGDLKFSPASVGLSQVVSLKFSTFLSGTKGKVC